MKKRCTNKQICKAMHHWTNVPQSRLNEAVSSTPKKKLFVKGIEMHDVLLDDTDF